MMAKIAPFFIADCLFSLSYHWYSFIFDTEEAAASSRGKDSVVLEPETTTTNNSMWVVASCSTPYITAVRQPASITQKPPRP